MKGVIAIVRRSDEPLAAPQLVWPMTKINLVLKWSMAYSMLAVTSVSTTLPATRITNRSPSLDQKQVRVAHVSRCIPERRRTDVVLFPAIVASRVYRVGGVIFRQRT